jgi:DNA-binding CsgD family transcriptional regulator
VNADIVDRIYEAAALPELWPRLFHDISKAHGFVGGAMFSANPKFQRGVASPDIEEALAAFFAGGWQERNSRAPRTAAKNYPGFVRDEDILTEEEIATDPMYVELLRPFGLGYGAGSVVNCPSGDQVVFTFERAGALGSTPVEVLAELDRLRPHLARASVFSARLDLERSRAQVEALAELGLPAAVLGPGGRALAANDLFEAFQGQASIGAWNAVTLKDPAAHRLFLEALEGPIGEAAFGRSMAVRATGEARPAVLHLLPVRRLARDVFSQAAWLLVATPLGRRAAPEAAILAGLFDLTPAEARVAHGLVRGDTLSEIAAAHDLADSTVRNQLRAVFAKTGASRQAELVALCGGLGLRME